MLPHQIKPVRQRRCRRHGQRHQEQEGGELEDPVEARTRGLVQRGGADGINPRQRPPRARLKSHQYNHCERPLVQSGCLHAVPGVQIRKALVRDVV